jgi:hypothetical protein
MNGATLFPLTSDGVAHKLITTFQAAMDLSGEDSIIIIVNII